MRKYLIGLGLLIVGIGVLYPLLSKIGVGRLPGDILIQKDGWTFYFPIITCVILSIIISILFKWFK